MRKCILCGKEYEYCPTCPKDKDKAPWHKLYHSENCRNIFNALNDYNFKLVTKSEAKTRLSACDLTIDLNDHYRGEINDIMAFNEAPIESVPAEEIVAEPEVIEPKPKRGTRAKAKIVEEGIPEEIKNEVVE